MTRKLYTGWDDDGEYCRIWLDDEEPRRSKTLAEWEGEGKANIGELFSLDPESDYHEFGGLWFREVMVARSRSGRLWVVTSSLENRGWWRGVARSSDEMLPIVGGRRWFREERSLK